MTALHDKVMGNDKTCHIASKIIQDLCSRHALKKDSRLTYNKDCDRFQESVGQKSDGKIFTRIVRTCAICFKKFTEDRKLTHCCESQQIINLETSQPLKVTKNDRLEIQLYVSCFANLVR